MRSPKKSPINHHGNQKKTSTFFQKNTEIHLQSWWIFPAILVFPRVYTFRCQDSPFLIIKEGLLWISGWWFRLLPQATGVKPHTPTKTPTKKLVKRCGVLLSGEKLYVVVVLYLCSMCVPFLLANTCSCSLLL